jgi:hypothetical protein
MEVEVGRFYTFWTPGNPDSTTNIVESFHHDQAGVSDSLLVWAEDQSWGIASFPQP